VHIGRTNGGEVGIQPPSANGSPIKSSSDFPAEDGSEAFPPTKARMATAG